MNVMRATIQDAAVGVAVTEKPENLSAFLKPGCAAAIWRRQLDAGFLNWVECLDPAHLPQGRLVVQPTVVRSAVTELCTEYQTPICLQRGHVAQIICNSERAQPETEFRR